MANGVNSFSVERLHLQSYLLLIAMRGGLREEIPTLAFHVQTTSTTVVYAGVKISVGSRGYSRLLLSYVRGILARL
jgi:hypothetical protein